MNYQTVDNHSNQRYGEFAQMRQSSPWDQQVSLRQIHPWDRFGLPRRVRSWDQFDRNRWDHLQELYKQQHQAQQQMLNQDRIRQQRREQHARMVKRNRMIRIGIGLAIRVLAVAMVLFAIYSLIRWASAMIFLARRPNTR